MLGIVLILSLLFVGRGGSVTCRNPNNGEVDWFILYKSPTMASKDKPNLTGLRYLYMDSNSREVSSLDRIDHPNSALGNTLRPIFRSIRTMEPNFGFISYSDQPPGCNAVPTRFGHSKGLLMVDRSSSGVWLSHSTPRFPFRRQPNSFWPPNGNTNAQTFICGTFNYDQFRTIGSHLKRIRAFPFEHDVPENFHQELKDVVNWVEQSQEPDAVLIQDMSSSKGKTFKMFAKNTSYDVEDGDLYVRIAKNLVSNVYVQVWGQQQDEPHGVSGQCVKNIESIKTVLGEWKPKADHSKWCVAEDQNKHWTCIADMNRCSTQYQRFGGALCIQDEGIQNKFLQFAKVISTCRKRPAPHPQPQCSPDYDSGSIDLHPLIIDTRSDPDTHMDPPQVG